MRKGVYIQGVPAYGILDSGAYITSSFKKVSTTVRLKKRDFMRPDKTPRTYVHEPFTLDGMMELDIAKNNAYPYVHKNGRPQPVVVRGSVSPAGDVEVWRGRRHEKGVKTTVRVNLVDTIDPPSTRPSRKCELSHSQLKIGNLPSTSPDSHSTL